MRAYTPLNKSSTELLLELINKTNAINPPLTFDKVSFDPPAVLADALVAIFKSNTKVIVKDKLSSGYINSRLVYYDRVAVNELFTDEEVVVSIDFATSEEAIAAFNESYGLALTAEDIEKITMVTDRRVELTIGNSYVYLPGSKLALLADTVTTQLEDYAHRVWTFVNYELPKTVLPV